MIDMKAKLQQDAFSFISPENKEFIMAFDQQMQELGYDCGDEIGSGFCWGKYMLIYRKTGAKSKAVTARIYIREDSIILRLFLNKVDRHRAYVEQAADHIQEAFTGVAGNCKFCKDYGNGDCKFRKSYTIAGREIHKCNGWTFEFPDPNIEKLPDYIGLYKEFFPMKVKS